MASISDLTVSPEDFDSLAALRADTANGLKWDLVFTLPAWLKVWWQSFGSGGKLYLRSVKKAGKVIGIAPLQIREGRASIVGGVNVCDYQDFIVVPGMEKEFFGAILTDLCQKGIKALDLEPVRPDATVMTHLMPMLKECGYRVECCQADVSSDIELPRTWEEYLNTLDGKQRHELRRKQRNLQEMGDDCYCVIEAKEDIPRGIDCFLKLFPESRSDKAEFMTPPMQAFFRSLAMALGETGVVKFGSLGAPQKPIAMVMYFDYNESIYLYNSAYDPAYRAMSAGIISKAMCIQDAIEKGKKKFDFLKGAEQYKYYLKGQEIPLSRVQIDLATEQ